MFWGSVLKQGQNYKLGKSEKLVSPLLHISNATLTKGEDKKDIQVFTKVEDKEFVIARLEKGKQEHVALDLFFMVD
jgi:hypothetical protein